MSLGVPDSKLLVAAAQIDVALFDVEANVEKHIRWITEARAQGIQLLVFPELSLTGYKIGARGYELGMDVRHPLLLRLAEAAGEMRVVVGFIEEGYAAQYFCAAAYLQGGRVKFVHRKLNLANYGAMEEAKFFAAGRYLQTVPVSDPFTGAILLCADMWNPALVHLAALHGATLLMAPTNSSLDAESGDFSKPGKWQIALQFYSGMYGMPIVFANRIGTESGHTFWGGSRIMDPHGEVVAEAGRKEETLVVGELSYNSVRRTRFELPTVRDSNLSLVQREINRLSKILGVPDPVPDDR